MSEGRVERRLAAILAADVAGYSRLVGEDEAGTLRLLRTCRRELIDPKIGENKGRIVKTTGDGLLAEFTSTVEALICASEIQAGMPELNDGIEPGKRIELRVGIHQGDIVVQDDGDILGDGVNIAARLESLAQPGGICVSARVREDAAGKLDMAFRDLGEQRLRNIARPVRVYAVGPVAPRAPGHLDHGRGPRRTLVIVGLVTVIALGIAAWHMLPQQIASRREPVNPPAATGTPAPAPSLSVVVLPFANLSSDPEQEYFADAITDDLTTDLSRIAGSFVIARTTAFTFKGKAADVKQIGRELGVRYVLEGSVRRLGDRVQVNVQLIDANTGAHAWADRFDTNRRDLAEAQSEITSRLARSLGLELVNQAARRVSDNPDAADQVLRARALANRPFSPEIREQSLQAFGRALEMDPASIEARIGIAWALATGPDGNGTATPQDAARADRLLREVMDKDPNRSEAYRIVSVLRTAQGRWDEAEEALRTALALDPNNAAALRNLGQRLHLTGRSEAAIPLIEKALRLSPRDPGVGFGYLNLGDCYLFMGREEDAMVALRKAVALIPQIFYAHLVLAGALGLKGDLDAAKAEIAEARRIKPDVASLAKWRESLQVAGLNHPVWLAQMDKTVFEGLRRAGFPNE